MHVDSPTSTAASKQVSDILRDRVEPTRCAHDSHHSSSILRSRKSLLISHNFLIETSIQSTYSSSSFKNTRHVYFNDILAKRSGHFEFKTLWSPTVVRLVSAAGFQVQELRKIFNCLRLRRRPYYFFLSPIERKEIARNFSHRDYFARLSKSAVPRVSSEKVVFKLLTLKAPL